MNEKVIYSRLAKAPKQLPMDYSAQKPKQLDENLLLSLWGLYSSFTCLLACLIENSERKFAYECKNVLSRHDENAFC